MEVNICQEIHEQEYARSVEIVSRALDPDNLEMKHTTKAGIPPIERITQVIWLVRRSLRRKIQANKVEKVQTTMKMMEQRNADAKLKMENLLWK